MKNIFLTKEEKEYLKWYQKKYHKLSLKEKKCIIQCNREYENKHIGWSEEEKERELTKLIYEYFGIKNEEEMYHLIKEDDDFVSLYESKYGKVSEEVATSIKMDFSILKKFHSKEECLKIIFERQNINFTRFLV